MIERIARCSRSHPGAILETFSPCCRPSSRRTLPQLRSVQGRSSTTASSAPPEKSAQFSDLRSQLPGAIPQPGPKRRSLFRPWLYGTFFALVGLGVGQYIRLVIKPPQQPEPGTKEDQILVSQIHAQAARLPLVQMLSNDPAWRSWDAYENFTPEERPHRLTTGPLAGARGIGGYQRVFHNATTGEFISVVWIGGHVTGWPGVAHGGVLVTLMDESLGRCAIARFPSHTGVTANLQMKYRRPTLANSFHVIRASPEEEGSTERKCRVKGRLETMDGRVCVESEALFVVPKTLKTKTLERF